jgi:hypothetical protein
MGETLTVLRNGITDGHPKYEHTLVTERDKENPRGESFTKDKARLSHT